MGPPCMLQCVCVACLGSVKLLRRPIRVAIAGLVLALLYLLTATCYVENQDQQRRYYGVCKVNANQTRQTAAARRLAYHRSHPVAWMKHALPDTMSLSPVGHCMSMQNALAEETIHTACAFVDGGDAVRGGPWCGPHVGSVGRSEKWPQCVASPRKRSTPPKLERACWRTRRVCLRPQACGSTVRTCDSAATLLRSAPRGSRAGPSGAMGPIGLPEEEARRLDAKQLGMGGARMGIGRCS